MQLLETIKCFNERLCNLEFHQARFDAARKQNFPEAERVLLQDLIQIPETCKKGLFRCRVVYSNTIHKVEFIPHQFRKVESLKIVHEDNIDYTYKNTDRAALNALFAKRGNADDILIVKNGFISDSFTANPIFFDGEKWWTTTTPLLAGTQREFLLKSGKIQARPIRESDLHNYKKVGLLNALWDLSDMPIIDIQNIVS